MPSLLVRLKDTHHRFLEVSWGLPDSSLRSAFWFHSGGRSRTQASSEDRGRWEGRTGRGRGRGREVERGRWRVRVGVRVSVAVGRVRWTAMGPGPTLVTLLS